MSLIGNIIWLIFGGFFTGLGYIFGGLVLCLSIIGIPFGLQAIKLGIATFAPFGKEVEKIPQANSLVSLVFNVIWIILFGWEIALINLGFGLLLAITVIGFPFALQHFKLTVMALFPFGHRLI